MAQPDAGASTWKPPVWPEILRRPLPYPGMGDRWLMRLMALIARRQIISISGLDHVRSDRDPFIVAANHSTRREAVLFPTMLIFLRGGRLIHFLSDWNNSLLPGVGFVMHRARVVTVVRKPARPKFLNVLKPLFRHPKPAHERAIDLLRAGRAVGAFPEGTVNRDPNRMLPGRTGTAWLSLRTGAPVVPVGIRYPFVKEGEQITERSPMEIHIGKPMYPRGVSHAPTLAEVRAWHEKIMREISALSGKSWSPARAKTPRSVGREVSASRVRTAAERDEAITILKATYEREKSWVRDADGQFPFADLEAANISWFVARIKGKPAGVLRVLYDPPLGLYAKYGFKLIDQSLDVEAFVKNNRVAEIGRFAVMPEHRSALFVAAALMRGATAEAVTRGYSHLVTDVFEDDPHSPYGFHTRVIGFQPVATHDVGELNTTSRRITLLLDLAAAYKRLKASRNWFYRYMTDAWDEATHKRMAA